MVLTRRGAKAAAEAAAAKAAAAAQAAKPPAAPVATSDTSSSPSTATKPSGASQKAAENSLRASIAWRLWIGHLCALASVTTLAHAATCDARAAHPLHALLLLLFTLPLRAALAFSVHSLRAPAPRSGMVLALSAPVLFASNALHVLATRAAPSRLLQLIACSAVDICAAWLRMTVSAKTPSTEPFALPIALVYSAADIFLAAIVARQKAFVDLFFPFLGLRFMLNARLLVVCSVSIVRRDDVKRKAVGQPPR